MAPMQVARLRNERSVGFRFANGDDQAYIGRTWVASVVGDGHAADRHAFRDTNDLVDRILDEATTHILVCCEPADRKRIIGWIAYTTGIVPVLLYINVRHHDRKQGIGRELFRRAGLDEARQLAYLWAGPSAEWAKQKRPNAVHISPNEYLST